MNDSQASLPFPLRINLASGSVLLSWVSFFNLSPRKFTHGLPGVTGSSPRRRAISTHGRLDACWNHTRRLGKSWVFLLQ